MYTLWSEKWKFLKGCIIWYVLTSILTSGHCPLFLLTSSPFHQYPVYLSNSVHFLIFILELLFTLACHCWFPFLESFPFVPLLHLFSSGSKILSRAVAFCNDAPSLSFPFLSLFLFVLSLYSPFPVYICTAS